MKFLKKQWAFLKAFVQVFFLEKEKTVLLKNCDWFQLHRTYCTVSHKHYADLDHMAIICGIDQLQEQCTGNCTKDNCPTYDHLINEESAKALITLIDVALMDLSDSSISADQVKEEFLNGIREVLKNIPGLGKLQVATPVMDTMISEAYETLSRIKTQLQK